MTVHNLPTTPAQELREAVKELDVGEGWVLVKAPSSGPISVAAYSDMALGEVMAFLQLGVHIMGNTILYDDADEPEAS